MDTGAWEKSITLDVIRDFHVSWTPHPDIGTFLMGGYTGDSQNTATLIKPDGSQEPAFFLKYDTRYQYQYKYIKCPLSTNDTFRLCIF